MDSEFDKAYSTYESIVNDEPENAEAYWGMLLSEYGVEYVDDPKTGKKVPTCHRTLVRSVTSSSNYKSACKYADAESRIMYEDDAAVLDSLQKRVLNASAKEEPYDVFICYKETDDKGERTEDSVLAHDIYDALTAKGMRVFFSRISLEDKLGQDYEPCIFAALNSAKVMLMVTTDSDHCNAVWVKNEWKRYLDFMKNDPAKTLIPVYKGISPYTLPDEFAKLQAQDMGKLGAIQDLVRGVEKLAGKNQKAAAAGMTKEEKKMMDAMQRGQQNSRFYILAFAVFVVSFLVVGFTIADYEHASFMDWVLMRSNDKVIDLGWLWNWNDIILPALVVFPLIGLVSWITHGLKQRFPKWVFTVQYILVAISMIFFQMRGYVMGVVLWGYLALFAVFALISAIITHRSEGKELQKHLIIMAVILLITILAGAL